MTKKYEIPPDLREWCEATAPTLTTFAWQRIDSERLMHPTSFITVGAIDGQRIDINGDQARALLAYADEVAAGLTGGQHEALCDYYAINREPHPRIHVSVLSALDRKRLVCRVNDTRIRWGKATDWGRYIAGRAAALRGDQ